MTVQQASLTGYSINPHQWRFSDQLVRLNSTQFDTVKYRETFKLENKSEAHSQSTCVSQFNRHEIVQEKRGIVKCWSCSLLCV